VLGIETRTALPPIRQTPGVRQIGNASIADASEAAQLAVSLARHSAATGTFGVGGLLVDGHGRILAEAVNSVLIGGALYDPTCHVERQLIDWFMATNRGRTRFARDDLTIVNSLDPCAMCAGAIMRSGMKAVSVSEDAEAGIHAARNVEPSLEALKQQIWRHFAFFAVGRSESEWYNQQS
jgi:cytosine deaminase